MSLSTSQNLLALVCSGRSFYARCHSVSSSYCVSMLV